MFTGIIEATAKILQKTDSGLFIERPKSFDDIKIGSSIAIAGVCLSVTRLTKKEIQFDVVETTLSKTKLGLLKKGDAVNLERAMSASGRFDGHIVTGHVEGVGLVEELAGSAISPTSAYPEGRTNPSPLPETAPTPNPSPVPETAPVPNLPPLPETAPTPNPSPLRGEGNEGVQHVWKGTPGLSYAPSSVIANARAMRKEPTLAEKKLWEALRGKKLGGFYFRRQRPIGSCIVDFYCEDCRLAIEVDGDIHAEKNQKDYDEWREEHLRWRGVHILRFSNDEVLNNIEQVLQSILDHINAPLPPEGGGAGGGGTNNRGEFSQQQATGGGGTNNHNFLLTLSLPSHLLPYIVPHGSITIDGVSLTVAAVKKSLVTVALIPHTLAHTTLGTLHEGDAVNIETDILAKYLLSSRHGSK